MVRPGLKRLRSAQSVKTDPRQTGLSHSVGRTTTNLKKREVVTPSKTLMPNFIYTETEKNRDRCEANLKTKVYKKDNDGNIIN